MSFFSRLLGIAREDESDVSALWRRIVAVAREREWYADCGVADSVPGRFDAITTVLALALLRMEGSREMAAASVRLTELFVEDMDGQLREAGIGDMVVGKHIGKLMSAMGGWEGAGMGLGTSVAGAGLGAGLGAAGNAVSEGFGSAGGAALAAGTTVVTAAKRSSSSRASRSRRSMTGWSGWL